MTDNNKKKLLIVDDEVDLRDLLYEQLIELDIENGLEIHQAENGKIALDLAQSEWFDAILSDINMPIMTGLEFLANLRKTGSETPVVFLTGFADKSKAIEALRLDAFDFLEKPWVAANLRQVISNAVGYGFALRDLEQQLNDFLIASFDQFMKMPPEKQKEIREAQRSLLKLKTNRIALQSRRQKAS